MKHQVITESHVMPILYAACPTVAQKVRVLMETYAEPFDINQFVDFDLAKKVVTEPETLQFLVRHEYFHRVYLNLSKKKKLPSALYSTVCWF